jgi:hypothetical protein
MDSRIVLMATLRWFGKGSKMIQHPRVLIISCVAILAAAGFVMRMHGAGGAATVKASDVAILTAVPAQYVTPLAGHQLRFAESVVAPLDRPMLPGGRSGLSAQEAVSAALAQFPATTGGILNPGVQIAARYGIFSNDVYAKVTPDGTSTLMFQDRPAWIISFFGPGISIRSRGPGTFQPHHTENVVIDAQTGEWMESFS